MNIKITVSSDGVAVDINDDTVAYWSHGDVCEELITAFKIANPNALVELEWVD